MQSLLSLRGWTINQKQSRFIDEYLIDLNATRAYGEVYTGCSYETSQANGHKLLRNTEIKKEIEKRLDESMRSLKLTRERILTEYEKIAFSNIDDFMKFDGEVALLKPSEEIPTQQKACIQEINTTTGKDGEGSLKFKLYDKMKALESLAKYSLLFDSVEDDTQNDVEFYE